MKARLIAWFREGGWMVVVMVAAVLGLLVWTKLHTEDHGCAADTLQGTIEREACVTERLNKR